MVGDPTVDYLPLEFLNLPEASVPPIDDVTEPLQCAVSVLVLDKPQMGIGYKYRGRILGKSRVCQQEPNPLGTTARSRVSSYMLRKAQSQLLSQPMHCLKQPQRHHGSFSMSIDASVEDSVHRQVRQPECFSSSSDAAVCFATHSSFGVLDLGASKSVIGSESVAGLIAGLNAEVRGKLSRCPCHVTFRFGNSGTLTSQYALVVPLGTLKLKIAIVEGNTPFLLSNTLMRVLQAEIDCHSHKLRSPLLSQPVPLSLTTKGLFLIDLNQLVLSAKEPDSATSATAKSVHETFVTDDSNEESKSPGVISLALSKQETNKTTMNINNQSSNFPCFQTNPESEKMSLAMHHPPSDIIQHVEVRASENTSSHSKSLAQDSPELNQINPVVSSHVTQSAIEETAGTSSGRHPGSIKSDVVRAGGRDRALRREAQGEEVLRGMEGSRMGGLHGSPVLSVNESAAPKISQVCGDDGRVPRTPPVASHRDHHGQHWYRASPSHDSGSPDGKGQASPQAICSPYDGRMSFANLRRGRRGLGVRFSDVPIGIYDCPESFREPRVSSHESTTPTHGECPPARDWPSREADGSEPRASVSILGDDLEDGEVFTTVHQDQLKVNQLILEFQAELDHFVKTVKPLGKRFDLGEVFCGSHSTLTQQVRNLGGQAFRFGLEQGDLSSADGRSKLFTLVATHRPKNLWISPVCKPWSAWTRLNESRSDAHFEYYQHERQKLLYQIALVIVLFRHQLKHASHCHMEQPKGSLLMRQPVLSEVFRHSQVAEFDMCRAGDLRCPQTGRHMQKGMLVTTTHEPLYQRLHGQKCHHGHEHQPIEGSIASKHGPILRSEFSENYPRKFSRMVAKVLFHAKFVWPFHWQPGLLVQDGTDAPAVPALVQQAGVFRKTTAPREQFAKSELVSPGQPEGEDHKRRRVSGKQTPTPTVEELQKLIQRINGIVPRVGRISIQDVSIQRALQNLFPEKRLVKVIACRGTDRTMAPPTDVVPAQCPFRRSLMVMRPSGDIQYEKHWEKWMDLSKRRLVRPSHSCRLHIAVFAQDHPVTLGNSSSSQDSQVGRVHDIPRVSEAGSLPVRPPEAMPPESPPTSEPPEHDMQDNPQPQPQVMIHGPRFRALPKWEQNQIIKMHKNLGHPSPDRLAKALQSAGYPHSFAHAAFDYQCTACAQCSPPKVQRPAHLKPMMDFNHKIYLDGVEWTNNQGNSMYFYHVIDGGSNYHVAYVAPSHTTKDAIGLLHQHWLCWAGAPHELQVDSGTELNSQEFEQFLMSFGIKGTTTCPEASWQNGKIERHGKFLQEMLSRIDMEIPITSYAELQATLNQCTHAKNSLCIKQGYSPELIVFGKNSRLPGSILSDDSLPSHASATQEDGPMEANTFRGTLQLREAARRAYHAADNSSALRKAILARSRPSRGHYVPNTWIMIWRTRSINKPGWMGPQKVILQDSNHTVWSTQCGKLYRSAPEHVRMAFPEEITDAAESNPLDITTLQMQVNRMANAVPTSPRESPVEIPLEENPNVSSPDIVPEENNQEPQNQPAFQRNTSTQQPDQEPEASQNSSSDEDTTEPTMFLSVDEPCALSVKTETDLAWRCEFDMPIPDAYLQQEPSPAEAWILLATQGKKQRSEVRLTELSSSERQEFETAKQKEVANWIQTGTISKILRNQIPESQILKCRWILTWKPIDPTEVDDTSDHPKTHKAKARLVILGYMDPKIEEIPRDSPTLNKTSRMLIMQLVASHGWNLMSFDIKAAFLQGTPQKDRVIGVDPVPELRSAMSMQPAEVGILNKGAYGLIDAPYLWYCALVKELTRLGMEPCPFDPCVFVLRENPDSPNPSKICGVLGIHVDDGLCGGNEQFMKVLGELEKTYPFGSKKSQAFTFTGIEVTQHGDKSISLSQSAYVRKIPSIQIEPNRKTQPDLPVTESERGSLRGLVGSLQYAAVNTRPDLASRLSILQSSINKATIETLQEGNRLLHEAKRYHEVTIFIKPIDPKSFRFMSFSDASFASAKKPDSHAGLIIVGTHKDISNNQQCPISPISWSSKKIQKVVTSTLSAETTAMAAAMDQLSWLRLYWQWLHDPNTPWKQPEQALSQIPSAISVNTHPETSDLAITDCKSLYDLISRTAPPSCSEFRVQLVARAIREHMKEGTQIRWVHTGAQLADALTKSMSAHFLRSTLAEGTYRLHDETQTLRDRATSRDRIRWLKQVQPT